MAQKNVEINVKTGGGYDQLYPLTKTANVVDLSLTATNVSYNNTTSGLQAINVQTAIDELNTFNFEVVTVNVSTYNMVSVSGSVVTMTDNTTPSETQTYTLTSTQSSASFKAIPSHSITISVSAKSGFKSPDSISFTAVGGKSRNIQMEYYKNIYGYRITKANSDPYTRVDYIENSVGKTPSKMNYGTNSWEWGGWEPFIKEFFRPCMLNFDGTVAYYLDQNDQTKKADGSPSDIGDVNFGGNAMVEVKKLYTYEYEDATYSYHIVSDQKIDANYVAYPFTNSSGVEKDFAYFPMFEGALDASGKIRSIAEQNIAYSNSGDLEIRGINKNGAGYYTDYWSAHNFLAIMHTLIGKSTDSQTVFGNGVTSASGKILSGTLKAYGGFFGYSNSTSAVKTFWMENNWGNIRKRCMGITSNQNTHIMVKMNGPYNEQGSLYTDLGLYAGQGYIKNIVASNNGYKPSDSSGSITTYFCDWNRASQWCYGIVSGYWANGNACGCYYITVDTAFSDSMDSIGCRPFFIAP